MTEELDQRIRALANPTRRLLLNLCWHEPRAAGDLSSRVDLAPASVSEHLKSLTQVGLVDVTRIGTWRFYRTNQVAVCKALDELHGEFPSGGAPTEACPDVAIGDPATGRSGAVVRPRAATPASRHLIGR